MQTQSVTGAALVFYMDSNFFDTFSTLQMYVNIIIFVSTFLEFVYCNILTKSRLSILGDIFVYFPLNGFSSPEPTKTQHNFALSTKLSSIPANETQTSVIQDIVSSLFVSLMQLLKPIILPLRSLTVNNFMFDDLYLLSTCKL